MIGKPASFLTRISLLGTQIFTAFNGKKMGKDPFGNIYYEEKKPAKGQRAKRWVIYAGEPEASTVPPEWHGWLHYALPAPLETNDSFHKPWQKEHKPNLTGSNAHYLPPGAAEGGVRNRATGDYQAWRPE